MRDLWRLCLCVRDGFNFRFIQHAETAKRKRQPSLGFGLCFHHGVCFRIALQPAHTDSAHFRICTARLVAAGGNDAIDAVVHGRFALCDGHAVDTTQLICTRFGCVQRQLAIEPDVRERCGGRVQPKRVTDVQVVIQSLFAVQFAEVALYQQCFKAARVQCFGDFSHWCVPFADASSGWLIPAS